MLLLLNAIQAVEAEAEAEHQQAAGSQHRAWGMVTSSQECSHRVSCELNYYTSHVMAICPQTNALKATHAQ